MAKQPAEKSPVRDVRVDRIGLVSELVKRWVEGPKGLKAGVKAKLKLNQRAVGDLFGALLVPCRERSISPRAVLKLADAGKLSQAQLLSMLTVKVAVAEKCLDSRTFAKLVQSRPGEPRLNVERLTEAEIPLIDAVNRLQRELAAEQPDTQA